MLYAITNHHGPMELRLRLRGGAGSTSANRKRSAPEQRSSRGTGPSQPRHRAAAPEAPVHMPAISDESDEDEEAYDPSEPSDDAPSPSASNGSNDNNSTDDSDGDEDAGKVPAPEAARRAANGGGLTHVQLQVEMLRQQRKTVSALQALARLVPVAPAPAPAPVQRPRHARTAGGGQARVPPIEELGQHGGRYENSFADMRGPVLARLMKCGRLALEPVRVPAQP